MARSIEILHNLLLGEENYDDIKRQSIYADPILALCCTAVLNDWYRIEEVIKVIESFTNVIQRPKETFTSFYKD